jgi:CoA:oxalate CoA-transferase
MDRHRVPVAPVLSVGEAMQHPHLRERRTVRTVPDPIVGQVELPGFPLRFSAFPDGLPVQAPTLGQHNLEVLEKYLGYSAERVKQLEAQNILVRKHC